MSRRESGPVLPLEQRCDGPGRWMIEGRWVRAFYSERSRSRDSRNIIGWYCEGHVMPFVRLNDVREWIRQEIESGR